MNERRYDLDWLRIGALALLILYHVGMFYVSWDWHVNSSRASEALEPLMLLTNPWRLTLLFLVAGAATRFMADKMNALGFASARMGRLWPPLLLAVFVIVPPQAYYEIYEALEAMGVANPAADPWLANFYVKYVTASGNWCDGDGCLITPTYNHMWFVAYLIVYTLLLLPLLPLLRRMRARLGVLISGPLLIVTPWLVFFALRVTLFPAFGQTHMLVNDFYLHALYFGVFVFGFAIARHQPFFDACVRWRFGALVLALAAWVALSLYFAAYRGDADPPEWQRFTFRGVRELQAWCAIVALLGFAHLHLKNADGPIRRVLTVAIFPCYLAHQTITVVAGHYLDDLAWPLWLEASALIGVTLLGCGLFYALAQALPPLRVWAGLPSKAKQNHATIPAQQAGEAR